VPGLNKDRVSVVSTEGLTLHRPNSDANGSIGENADMSAEQSKVIASQLEADAQAQLERVVGPGNADVRVNVDLNPAAKERTEELYEPSKTALRSEHKTEEVTGTAEAGVAGVPGAKSNLPDAKDADNEDAAPAGGGGVRKSQTRNWEVQRITQKTTTPPGEIRRLSVAVVLNGRYEKHGEKSVFVPRTPDEVQGLESIVKHAVGFNQERGDEVELRAVQFARLDTEEPQVLDPLAKYRRYLPFAAAGLVGILLLTAIIMVWRRSKAKKAAEALAPALAEAQLAGFTPEGNVVQLGTNEARTLLLEDTPGSEEIRARALELAAKDPATAAVVLRRWLSAGAPELAGSASAAE